MLSGSVVRRCIRVWEFCLFLRAAIMKYQNLGGGSLKRQTFIVLFLAARSLTFRCRPGRALSEGSRTGPLLNSFVFWTLVSALTILWLQTYHSSHVALCSLWVSTLSSLCVVFLWFQSFPSYKDISHVGLGSTLMSLF